MVEVNVRLISAHGRVPNPYERRQKRGALDAKATVMYTRGDERVGNRLLRDYAYLVADMKTSVESNTICIMA